MNYYQIIGKNRYVPKTYYTEAPDKATAKQHFYLDAGDEITTLIQITKKQFTHATTSI